MNDSNAITRARISALADGCLEQDALAQTLAELATDADAAQTWHAYHVVGDVLRSAALAPSASDGDFLTKFNNRLLLESARPPVAPVGPLEAATRRSANASVFRWKMAAGVACTVAGVLSVALWSPAPTQNLAQSPVRPETQRVEPQLAFNEAASGPMLRDPALDALMAEHRQFGGHSALQVPAGFLRNATYEGGAR